MNAHCVKIYENILRSTKNRDRKKKAIAHFTGVNPSIKNGNVRKICEYCRWIQEGKKCVLNMDINTVSHKYNTLTDVNE